MNGKVVRAARCRTEVHDILDLECTERHLRQRWQRPLRQQGDADLFLPHHFQLQILKLCILPAYGVFDIYKNPDIPCALKDYQRQLEKYCL
jgi:hypothetical protein